MKTITLILVLGIIASAGFAKNKAASGSAGINEEKEKKAIIESIDSETTTFFKRDYKEVIKYYVHADYIFHAWNNSDGTYDAKVGWKAIDEKFKNYIGNNPVNEGSSSHPKVVRKNMIFKFFSPELAFVTWDQYNSDQEVKTYRISKETRIMEKQEGIWKIANMTSFWDYKNIIPTDIN